MSSRWLGRLVAAGLFVALGAITLLVAWRRTADWPGARAVDPAEWALLALLLGGAAMGLRAVASGRAPELMGAIGLVGSGWALHAVWRMSTVPPELRAVTFGGDVVQSCLALVLFANAVLWTTGVVGFRAGSLTTRGPPAR